MTVNWFDEVEYTFEGVIRADGHIDCDKFLKAAKDFTTILNDQTHLVFLPVKKRFGNNVRQMKDVYDELRVDVGPEIKITLHDLLTYEIATGGADLEKESALRGIVWFTRACQFLLHAFERSLGNEDEPLANSFRDAYSQTLTLHHDKMVKPLFDAAMLFCPDRQTFYSQMCRDDTMEKTLKSARAYFKVLNGVKERLVQFCVFHDFNVCYGNLSPEDMKKRYLNKRKRLCRSEDIAESSKKKKPSET